MSYADLDYYKNTYLGEDPGDDTELQKWLNRATDDIDIAYGGSFDEDDYHSTQWAALQNACSAQAEFYVMNGDTYNTDGIVQSASVGKFSYSGNATGGSSLFCKRARAYMMRSGVGRRSVTVRGREPYPYD